MSERDPLIRNGLTNYLGACAITSSLSPRESRHELVAILSEETLRIIRDNPSEIDMFVAKPLLRAAAYLLETRCQEFEQHAELQTMLAPVHLEYKHLACQLLAVVERLDKKEEGEIK